METIRLWKDEYRTGNDLIDAQHIELFKNVEELLTIAMTGDEAQNKRGCMEILDFLADYTVKHFKAEETVQKQMNYVSYEQHARIHSQFKNTVLNYKSKVSNDFSRETLKRFVGTLMTWLSMHVCGYDRKIMSNTPISPELNFDGLEDVIKEAAEEFLPDTFDIGITKTDVRVYEGYIDSKVVVRVVFGCNKKYVFLVGFSEEMARSLYRKISGLEIKNIDQPDGIESSALLEMGDMIASRTMPYVKEGGENLEWKGDLFFDKYSDDSLRLGNSVLVDFETDCGKLEILYCMVNR